MDGCKECKGTGLVEINGQCPMVLTLACSACEEGRRIWDRVLVLVDAVGAAERADWR
jgi:hypothetical protein